MHAMISPRHHYCQFIIQAGVTTIHTQPSFKQESQQYTHKGESHTQNNETSLQETLCFSKFVIKSKDHQQPFNANLPPRRETETIRMVANGDDLSQFL